MTEWLVNFHFLRPWWLLLAVIPLVILQRYLRRDANKSSWEKVIDERLLKYLLVKGSSGQRRSAAWLALIGIVSAIIAAAGPCWVKQELPTLEAENPLMIALNLSSDMKETDIKPNRLERAKYKIKDLLEMVPAVQSGLIVYSSEPFVISPFSDDGKLITNLLTAVNYDIMPANGDRADRAIALAAQKIKSGGYRRGHILLIAPDVGQNLELALQEAEKAKNDGVIVNILNASAQDNDKLKMIANRGGGQYIRLSGNDADVLAIANALQPHNSHLKESKNLHAFWLDYGYYLLAVPLLCCLYFFRRGILIVVLLLSGQPAQAGFWLNDNQEGLKAFEQGNFAFAENKFQDTKWKGAAYYRQNNYEAAYREFAKSDDITALYNQGNALAKGGKIAEAIKKYEEVLQAEPNHEDAKFNLEYLKKQQQQQNQSNQKDQQPQNKQSDNQENTAAGGSAGENSADNSQSQPEANEPNQGNDGQQEQKQPNGTDEAQNANGQPQSDDDKGTDQSGKSQQQPQSAGKQPQSPQDNKNKGGAALQKGDADDKYNEQMQAKTQQYREIPEDPGGLLKAFIEKEYNRKRYQD